MTNKDKVIEEFNNYFTVKKYPKLYKLKMVIGPKEVGVYTTDFKVLKDFIEDFKQEALAAQKKEIKGMIEGMRKEIPYEMKTMDDINAHRKEAETYDADCGFNQALFNLLKKIDEI